MTPRPKPTKAKPRGKALPPIYAWTIRTPSGVTIPSYTRCTRRESIDAVMSNVGRAFDWDAWYRRGARCVRVEIREVPARRSSR